MRNHSYENARISPSSSSSFSNHFRMKSFARGVILKQRKKMIVYSLVALPLFLKGNSQSRNSPYTDSSVWKSRWLERNLSNVRKGHAVDGSEKEIPETFEPSSRLYPMTTSNLWGLCKSSSIFIPVYYNLARILRILCCQRNHCPFPGCKYCDVFTLYCNVLKEKWCTYEVAVKLLKQKVLALRSFARSSI